MWGGSPLSGDTDSKAELTRVIVQCSERGNLPQRESSPAVGQEGGTGNAPLQGAWEKVERLHRASSEQAQDGLSLRADSDFGTLRWLEAQCGGPQHQVGSLMVGH